MSRGRKTALALGTLALGVCAALPFQKRSDKASPAPVLSQSTRDSDLKWRGLDVALEPKPHAVHSPAIDPIQNQPIPRNPQRETVVRKAPSLEASTPPPEFSSTYLPSTPKKPASPISAPNSTPASNSADESAQVPPLHHKIADGDSLQQLAKKYLGSERRYREIFEANRKVLSDPDLLPIGAEIVIPRSSN
jgi:nucleoid-associated protein YgaU